MRETNPEEPQVDAARARGVETSAASPYAGHRFGLEAPVGSRSVRGPTLFVLAIAAGLGIVAILRVLVNA